MPPLGHFRETNKLKLTIPLSYLLLLNFGLCVIVDGLLGIWQVLSPILNVCPLKNHTGTARQDQFLARTNSLNT